MAEMTTTPTKMFQAGATLSKFTRVKLSSGTLAAAGIADRELGVVMDDCVSGDPVAVLLRTATGTVKMIASAALALDASVYTAASGKVGASASTSYLLGTCLKASAADGDVIEVLRSAHGDTAIA